MVAKEIGIICNILAMAYLHNEEFKMAQELLKKAEVYTEHGNPRIKAITYNNFACLSRKTKKLRNALTYLEQALELEYQCLNYPDEDLEEELTVSQSLVISNPCEIHLNICAILSQMEKHEVALHHANKALLLIQDELLERTEEVSPDALSQQEQERFSVMICALHNIAVEHEFLKQYTLALTNYKKCRDLAVQSLGEEHPMT